MGMGWESNTEGAAYITGDGAGFDKPLWAPEWHENNHPWDVLQWSIQNETINPMQLLMPKQIAATVANGNPPIDQRLNGDTARFHITGNKARCSDRNLIPISWPGSLGGGRLLPYRIHDPQLPFCQTSLPPKMHVGGSWELL